MYPGGRRGNNCRPHATIAGQGRPDKQWRACRATVCEGEVVAMLAWAVEKYLGHFLEKLQKYGKVQNIASATKGRASRAPLAGSFLYFFDMFCSFSKKWPR